MSRVATATAPESRHIQARLQSAEWGRGPEKIVVGKDVLELVSTSMYVDPMSIYREYVQNAADAIDEARATGLIGPKEIGRVTIDIDAASRSIRIRDFGIGIKSGEFAEKICSLGASEKRGKAVRGFRGVGRLAGLGYCQELIFRTRATGDDVVSEVRWDCKRLKAVLRADDFGGDLAALVREIVSMRRIGPADYPSHFFEVEMRGVIRHRDDRLLTPASVNEYLSQVAPVPFSPAFGFGQDISEVLSPRVALCDLDIRLNGGQDPLFRPHASRFPIGEAEYDKFTKVDVHEIAGFDGDIAAVFWVMHHGYLGAIPNRALVKGIRFRVGNMQVGDHTLLEHLFQEPRFNSWAVGEVHILDRRIVPNGRRDHFEQGVHFDHLLNNLAPILRDISRRCRQSSAARKWIREFEVHKTNALENAHAVARGGVSRAIRSAQAQRATKALKAMEKIAQNRTIDDDARSSFQSTYERTQLRVQRLLREHATAVDPLSRFKPQTRVAYEHIIGLIYECSTNNAAARTLVDKILGQLEVTKVEADAKRARRRKSGR